MKKTAVFTAVAALSVMLYSATFAPQGYQVGDTARDFKLKSVDGKMVSMADNPDVKGYIVTFSCNTCPVVKLYEDRIIALHNQFASKGYPVIAINANDPGVSSGDSFEQMKAVAQSKKYPFPYLVDETQEIARTYGATNTPHVFVLKKEGNAFKVAYIGAIDDNQRNPSEVKKKYVETAVNELLSGKPVSTPTAKAVGCGIKWKEA